MCIIDLVVSASWWFLMERRRYFTVRIFKSLIILINRGASLYDTIDFLIIIFQLTNLDLLLLISFFSYAWRLIKSFFRLLLVNLGRVSRLDKPWSSEWLRHHSLGSFLSIIRLLALVVVFFVYLSLEIIVDFFSGQANVRFPIILSIDWGSSFQL